LSETIVCINRPSGHPGMNSQHDNTQCFKEYTAVHRAANGIKETERVSFQKKLNSNRFDLLAETGMEKVGFSRPGKFIRERKTVF
jgi:hypothetical protein